MNDIKFYEHVSEIEKSFPIKVRRYKQSSFSPHWHEHIEILHIIGGVGTFCTNAQSIEAAVGDTIIANSNELHYMSAQSDVEYFCIIINPSAFDGAGCSNVILKNQIPQDEFVVKTISEIYEEYLLNDACSDIVIKGKIYILTAHLIRNYASEKLSPSEYNLRIEKMKTIHKLLDYIHNNYKLPISTSALAKSLYISESHLCRSFKQAVGVSLIEYLNKFRIDKACILLKNTDESISDIAQNVGFENLNYFDRTFKRYKQISPGKFRQN